MWTGIDVMNGVVVICVFSFKDLCYIIYLWFEVNMASVVIFMNGIVSVVEGVAIYGQINY